MKTLVYSETKEVYYVEGLASPTGVWVSVEKFNKRPEPETSPFEGFVVIRDMKKGKRYYRKAFPFPYFKVRIGEKVEVEDDHELVQDYPTEFRDKEAEEDGRSGETTEPQ